MSGFDDLPADQKATLQLLLKQGKSYEELATLLRLEPGAVRERALNALDALGPDTTPGLAPERQDDIGDYLLGQQSASERVRTRSFLEGSAAGRAWARPTAAALRPLAGDRLPEIPEEAAEVDEAFGALSDRRAARERQEQSSKVGGVLLLLGGAAIIAVIVVLLVSQLGGSDNNSSDSSASSDTTSTQTSSTSTDSSTAANGGIESQIVLKSTTSDALAAGFVIKQATGRVLGINGQNFPPTDKTFNYAVWLYTSPTQAVRLGYVGGGVAASGANKGRLVTGADPATIAKQDPAAAKAIRAALAKIYDYKELVITREPVGKESSRPGTIVVAGPIAKS